MPHITRYPVVDVNPQWFTSTDDIEASIAESSLGTEGARAVLDRVDQSRIENVYRAAFGNSEPDE